MNQNPYRKRPVTVEQLIGDGSGAKRDNVEGLRMILDALTAKRKAKEAGNG